MAHPIPAVDLQGLPARGSSPELRHPDEQIFWPFSTALSPHDKGFHAPAAPCLCRSQTRCYGRTRRALKYLRATSRFPSPAQPSSQVRDSSQSRIQRLARTPNAARSATSLVSPQESADAQAPRNTQHSCSRDSTKAPYKNEDPFRATTTPRSRPPRPLSSPTDGGPPPHRS